MVEIKDIHQIFCKTGQTLGSVESFTGGLFAKEITAVAGASKFYKGGLVAYATETKQHLLEIENDLIQKYGVVSKQVAEAMAENGKRILNVNCCVSFTGNAGPDAMENKQVGEIYIGISYRNQTKVFSYQLEGDRNKIQQQSITLALMQLQKIMLQDNNCLDKK